MLTASRGAVWRKLWPAPTRTDPRRRSRFLVAYVQNVTDREVRQLAEIERARS